MKHTKGPWSYNEKTKTIKVSHDGDTNITIAKLYKLGADHEANGRLIAAAPEMLQALKSVYESLDQKFENFDQDTTYKQVLSAINKAEGKE